MECDAVALDYALSDQLLPGLGQYVRIYSLIEGASVGDFHFEGAHRSQGVCPDNADEAGPGNADALMTR
jgi:hypothetical protein